jgi:hypothetical protein
MNCIHPALYEMRRRTIAIRLRESISDVIPGLYRAIRRRSFDG